MSHCLSQHKCSEFAFLSSAARETNKAAIGSVENPPLPRVARLVDLHGFSTSSPKLRLVHTDNLGESIPPYAALSYCWGKDVFYKTTHANLEQGGRELPHDDLPCTFRDAFAIAKRLGVDYIWIDSLCIIQDSEADWNIESAKMPFIYSQALFCIAADSSASASGGCFNDSTSFDEFAEDPIVIRSSLSDGRESTLFVYQPAVGRFAPMTIETAPVAQRGWTFQERILSPRILHYTTEQVFWECRKGYIAQDGTKTWAEDTGPSRSLSGLVNVKRQDPWSLIQDWYREVIMKFSRRRLTYTKDKLPAISGIARAYYGGLQCPYIAGIWTYKLGFGLSWHREDSAPMSSQVFRQNSFSWSSVDGPLGWSCQLMGDTGESEFPLRLISWDTPLVNEHDPFGETGPCSLTFMGLLKKSRLSYEDCGASHLEWVVIGETEHGFVQMGTVVVDSPVEEQDVLCLPISTSGSTHLLALVLAQVPAQDADEKPKYSRLGLLSISRSRKRVDGKIHRVCFRCNPRWGPSDEGWDQVTLEMSFWFGDCEMQEVVLV